MKKLLICILALMLCGACALGEAGAVLHVANCNEYITLREEPSTSAAALDRIPLGAEVTELRRTGNGFVQVSYRGQVGYALSEYLPRAYGFRGPELEPSQAQRYNLNLFLSNFTEQGFLWRSGCYDKSLFDTAVLTDFAIDHCWFNRQNRLEWGDYFNDNNVRLSEDQIAPIVKKYFGVDISPSHDVPYLDYKKGYYYWCETGGHTSDGFACLTRVEAMGGGRYSVWFNTYGMGWDWNNDVCNYTASQAERAYPPYGDVPVGYALINTGKGGLDERSEWHVERYTISCE